MATAKPERGVPDDLDDQLRRDVVDALIAATDWQLTERRWAVVGDLVEAVSLALRTGDMSALRVAVLELGLAGPRRTGFDDPPVFEPPEQVRTEIVELIYTLDPEAAGR